MFKKIYEFIIYVFGGQMQEEQMELYIASRRPKTDTERTEVIQDYVRSRGGY